MSTLPATFIEHRVPQGHGNLYVRDYPGSGPAFVLMHGFPDNLHIYDDLIPYLVAAGRRVVTFDFLGFGASDKPADAAYGFQQQLADLDAIVLTLGLTQVIPVAHDASGAAALNFALARPERVDSVCMLNSVYAEGPTVHWPELIALFATPFLKDLSQSMLQSPEVFGWVLRWQQQRFEDALAAEHKPRFRSLMAPLIADNFMQAPSSAAAFAAMAADFSAEMQRNNARLPQLAELDVPVKLIWGGTDPYLTVAVARDRQRHLKRSSLQVLAAGHWLQVDAPQQVAHALLAPEPEP